MLTDECMVPMTENGNSEQVDAAPFDLGYLKLNWPTHFDRALEYQPIRC
jgi:hypothetical protein